MKPFTFEELQKILELKDTELEIDELLFKSTISNIEKTLGYPLEDHNYNELQTVRDCNMTVHRTNFNQKFIYDADGTFHPEVVDGYAKNFLIPLMENGVDKYIYCSRNNTMLILDKKGGLIVEIEGGGFYGIHAFRPSTAAFWAGMQRMNCSI